MGRLEHGALVAHVGARGDAQATNLTGCVVRDVVAVEVRGRNDRELRRLAEQLVERGVGDAVVEQDLAFRQLAAVHLPEVVLGHERVGIFLCRQLQTPLQERAFRVLLDVALVHDGHDLAAMLDRELDGGAHDTARCELRNRLDADARVLANRVTVLLRQRDEFERGRRAGGEFDARVDVFRVFAEDDHVQVLRALHHGHDAAEVAHGADAAVPVEVLAHGHVQAAHAAACGCAERTLQGDAVVSEHLQGVVGQGAAELRNSGIAGVGGKPVDVAGRAIALAHGSVDDAARSVRNLRPDAITVNERNDGASGLGRLAILKLDDFAVRSLDTIELSDRFCRHNHVLSSDEQEVR